MVAAEPDYVTYAREVSDLRVLSVLDQQAWGPATVHLGEVEVTAQVVSYVRRRARTGEFLGEHPLDLPERTLHTVAVWWTLPADLLAAADIRGPAIGGALHAAEHAAIGLLPLFATCDRWDIGGLSHPSHPDTQLPTIFVHDGHQGGAGFAERGFHAAVDWLTATRDLIAVLFLYRRVPRLRTVSEVRQRQRAVGQVRGSSPAHHSARELLAGPAQGRGGRPKEIRMIVVALILVVVCAVVILGALFGDPSERRHAGLLRRRRGRRRDLDRGVPRSVSLPVRCRCSRSGCCSSRSAARSTRRPSGAAMERRHEELEKEKAELEHKLGRDKEPELTPDPGKETYGLSPQTRVDPDPR